MSEKSLSELGWDPKLNYALSSYKDLCREYKREHSKLAILYNQRFIKIGILNIIIGMIAAFTALIMTNEYTISDEKITAVIIIGGAIINVLMSGIAAFMTFLPYQKKSEKHDKSSKDFAALERVCRNILRLPSKNRDSPLKVINEIEEEINSIIDDAPMLGKLIEDVEFKSRKNIRRVSTPSLTSPSPGDFDSFIEKRDSANEESTTYIIDLAGHGGIKQESFTKQESIGSQMRKAKKSITKGCDTNIVTIIDSEEISTDGDLTDQHLHFKESNEVLDQFKNNRSKLNDQVKIDDEVRININEIKLEDNTTIDKKHIELQSVISDTHPPIIKDSDV